MTNPMMIVIQSHKNRLQKPSLRTSESIIVRTVLISDFLTIVFLLVAEKARLSMTTLYRAIILMRIALLNP